jgi:hypothetical protein
LTSTVYLRALQLKMASEPVSVVTEMGPDVQTERPAPDRWTLNCEMPLDQ